MGLAVNAAGQGRLGLDAGQALPEAVGVHLRELGLREGVLDFLQFAGRAGVLLPFAGLEVAVRALLLLACQARGRAVGPGSLPLRIREEAQRLGSLAGLALGQMVSRKASKFSSPRSWEGAQDHHVLAAADSAGDHGAVGDVGPVVDWPNCAAAPASPSQNDPTPEARNSSKKPETQTGHRLEQDRRGN